MDEFDQKLYEEIMESKLFSDEEKEIIRGRFEKTEKAKVIYDMMSNTSPDSIKNALHKLDNLYGNYCEHDRHIMGTCAACHELAKKVVRLQPEKFKDDPWYEEYFAEE